MTRIRDEGFFDITSHEVLHGNDVQCRIRRGVLYYAGRRHKNGTLQDGVASFYIDNVPAQRMYFVADGIVVDLDIICDDRKIGFNSNSEFQIEADSFQVGSCANLTIGR